ncbi:MULTISPECIES: sporulation protein [Bacillaceae]|uniref:sporulation protein n=1 Tax=Bacillaceae TaxID=186817 RepID=UPI001BDEBE54|nr:MULTISPECIES: sporulation protein [Bacillaceae]MDX8361780.1 sporulation protein [Cytobacillus sp. IB215316]
MSFFNKMFASIGIGSTTVDTKLYNDRLVAGEEVKGIVELTGGNVDQDIDSIYLSVKTTYIKEVNDTKVNRQVDIGKFKINEPFTIKAGEAKEIPFSFELPIDTPVTMGKTKVWIQTGLDIKNAVDPSDKDYILVEPMPLTTAIFNSINELGFRLREVESEQAPYSMKGRLPFIQEFEFFPTSGPFRGKLDELELVFFPQSHDSVEVLMEVDRRARGLGGFLAEALEMDESIIRFTVTTNDMDYLTQKMKELIERYC